MTLIRQKTEHFSAALFDLNDHTGLRRRIELYELLEQFVDRGWSFRMSPGALHLTNPRGETIKIDPPSWIIRKSDELITVVSEDQFKENYEYVQERRRGPGE